MHIRIPLLHLYLQHKQGIGAFPHEYHVADDVNKLSIPGQL